MKIVDLGLIDYKRALEAQMQASQRVAQGEDERLFLLEHTPVITFGRNGGEEKLPFGRAYFEQRGVEIIRSSRGGSITCHFPGQLVVYPIMRIDRRPGGLRCFVHDLEECAIRTLAACGLKAARVPKLPGVWVQNKKICSIGIAVKHWITLHGLSLNISNDLSLFELVTPCGLSGVTAGSLHRELASESISIAEVKGLFIKTFCDVFRFSALEATSTP